jgi:hypothetical protein
MIAPIILSEDKYTVELDNYLAKHNYIALNLVKFKDQPELSSAMTKFDVDES